MAELLDELLSEDGWPYASTPPVEEGDPGRFHALFGRDSLITALQVLPARPEVARATLRALAERQGRSKNPDTTEEPGKIGHEFRDRAPDEFVRAGWPADGRFDYYGTADATSWFLVVLAATRDRELTRELDGAWRAAGAWLGRALDAGGGLVRHGPGRRAALDQQGWRDSLDPRSAYGGGILRPDGSVPTPPLADVDSQAVAYAALRALAVLDPDGGWEQRAHTLRARLSALGPDVVAVEAGDRPVPGAGSHLGWLLWADALDGGAREAAADRLCAPDVLTEFGLRTLASDSPVFSPHAYHRGSVWPFDSWLGWGGLRAAGREREAERVRRGVLTALDRLGRAPELYAVTPAGELEPVALSNRVQAWTVGARWALANEWDGLSLNPPIPAAPLGGSRLTGR
jgi:glycogen debranching enzyme